jgi:hypothetical protein
MTASKRTECLSQWMGEKKWKRKRFSDAVYGRWHKECNMPAYYTPKWIKRKIRKQERELQKHLH